MMHIMQSNTFHANNELVIKLNGNMQNLFQRKTCNFLKKEMIRQFFFSFFFFLITKQTPKKRERKRTEYRENLLLKYTCHWANIICFHVVRYFSQAINPYLFGLDLHELKKKKIIKFREIFLKR